MTTNDTLRSVLTDSDRAEVLEIMATGIMPHLPSSCGFDLADPTGYAWARNIAGDSADAAIDALSANGYQIVRKP